MIPPTWFPNLGAHIGEGADGSVYAVNDGTVVKFCKEPFDVQLLAEIAIGRHPHFVNVLDFGVGEDGTPFIVMERLNSITEDEAKVFHSIISHEDRNASKSFSPEKLDEVLDGLLVGLEFDKDAVFGFYRRIMVSPISHNDLHERNVMRDKYGSFRLVDLNRLSKEQ